VKPRLTRMEFEWAYMRWTVIAGVNFDEWDVRTASEEYLEGREDPEIERTFRKLVSDRRERYLPAPAREPGQRGGQRRARRRAT
jgi:hypothetical protein